MIQCQIDHRTEVTATCGAAHLGAGQRITRRDRCGECLRSGQCLCRVAEGPRLIHIQDAIIVDVATDIGRTTNLHIAKTCVTGIV